MPELFCSMSWKSVLRYPQCDGSCPLPALTGRLPGGGRKRKKIHTCKRQTRGGRTFTVIKEKKNGCKLMLLLSYHSSCYLEVLRMSIAGVSKCWKGLSGSASFLPNV